MIYTHFLQLQFRWVTSKIPVCNYEYTGTKTNPYCVPFCSSVVPLDRFLMILKYVPFADDKAHQYKTQKIAKMTDYGK
jgi:hypothetical protein